MTYFRRGNLYLVRDTRFSTKFEGTTVEMEYCHFIGKTGGVEDYYIRKINLGDPLKKGYRNERVLLKNTGINRKGKIINLEVCNGIL